MRRERACATLRGYPTAAQRQAGEEACRTPPAPLRRHGRGPKSPGKPAVQRPPPVRRQARDTQQQSAGT